MRTAASCQVKLALLLLTTAQAVEGLTSARFPFHHRSLVVATSVMNKPRTSNPSRSATCPNHESTAAKGMQMIETEKIKNHNQKNEIQNNIDTKHVTTVDAPSASVAYLSLAAFVLPLATMALPAHAAGAGVIPSALVAYVHYASLLVCVAALVVQRVMVKANMSSEQEDQLMTSEAVLGFATIALLVSGFYRIEFDKGLDFYIHEPLFWFKIVLAGVWGGSSLFPSTIIFKRFLERKTPKSTQAPISAALAGRLHQLLNAELTALLFIPLTATLMARGVWYVADFPWQAGAALSAVTWLGVSFKYGKDALTWKDPEPESIAPAYEE
jgi:uncharacterized membrane protein